MYKVVYIMGAGRSGTTLLDIFIGNSNNAFSMGEIRKLIELDGEAPGRDVDDKTYQFWRSIYDELLLESNGEIVSLDKLRNKYESHYMLPVTFIKTLCKKSYFINSLKKYYSLIYEKIYNKTQSDILVDSSKYPGRALLLDNLFSNIEFIYIIRPRKDVVNSFLKKDIEQPSKSWFMANLYYILMKIATDIVFLFIKNKKMKLYYSEFINTNLSGIYELEKFLDIQDKTLSEKAQKKQYLCTGSVFEGNRIRLKEKIILELKNV